MSLARLRGSESKTSGAEYRIVHADGRPVVVETESSEKSKLCMVSTIVSWFRFYLPESKIGKQYVGAMNENVLRL